MIDFHWKVCLAFWITGFAHIIQGICTIVSLGTIRLNLVLETARRCARHIYKEI